MDFDEYEYLEKTVENPHLENEVGNGGGDEKAKSEVKERSRSSRHRSDDKRDEDEDGRRSKRSRLHHRSRSRDRERDRHRSSRDRRDKERDDRDREKDRDKEQRNGKDRERDKDKDRDSKVRDHEKDRERDRSRRSRSRSERHRSQEREKSQDVEIKERDTKDRDRDRRRHKDKKEDKVEPEADPERDQRIVFASQIALRATVWDVYEFFSRAGKVRDVWIIMDRNSRRSRGIWCVEFHETLSVPMAIALSGQPLLGQAVMVKPSEAENNLVQSTTAAAGAGRMRGPYSSGVRYLLFVDNLPVNMSDDDLRKVFESFGSVERAQVFRDETDHCKGVGIVQFARLEEDDRKALCLNALEIAGRAVKVLLVADDEVAEARQQDIVLALVQRKPITLKFWHKMMLEINYLDILGIETNERDNRRSFEEVPLSFKSIQEYMDIFTPLMIEEFKAFLKNRCGERRYRGVMSVSAMKLDPNGDTFVVSLIRDENDNSNKFNANDLVHFTKEPPTSQIGGVNMLGLLARVHFYLPSVNSRLNQARCSLLKDSRWHATQIVNCTTQMREFQALSAIKDLDFDPLIMRPTTATSFQKVGRSSLPHELKNVLQGSYNKCQLQAVDVATTSPISLIQGPPGTGKTRTILAIISCLLATSDSGSSEQFQGSSTTPRPETHKKILICAQSNAAVDELVSRISRGIYKEDGEMFIPKLVRVGKGFRPDLLLFSLDAIVDKRVPNGDLEAKILSKIEILKDAQIVASTLSGCGGELFDFCSASEERFDAVLIDEAAQALEPTTWIPLQLLKKSGNRNIIMVGDHKQLPGTVFSTMATKYKYQRSMFERMQNAGHPILFLNEQYRMHSEISRFPSQHFYNNQLVDGVTITEKKTAFFHTSPYLKPYLLYDVRDGQEIGNSSKSNTQEARVAVQILTFFKEMYPLEFVPGRIGIISPYKAQVELLRDYVGREFGSQVAEEIEISTVDAFQGREVEILLLSTVRANLLGGIGFLADVRRMNVALTRAKLSLWVFCKTEALERDPNWGALVEDARRRGVIIDGVLWKDAEPEEASS